MTGSAIRPGVRLLARMLTALALAALVIALALVSAPRLVGDRPLVVLSGSMGAAAPVGSVAVTHPVPAGRVRLGDVIVRTVGGPGTTPVLHRVVARQDREGRIVVTTKGDANPTADAEPVALDGPVLVMRYAVPGVGYLISLAKHPLGWLVLVLGLAVTIWWPPAGRPSKRDPQAVRA